MKCLLAVFATVLLLPAGVVAQDDAYRDEAARQLVARARERRGTFDRAILEYRTRSNERISVGYRLLRRERLLFRRETAARIHWRRAGDTEVEVLGAREVVPVAVRDVQVPSDLADYMPHLVFDPLDSEFLLRLDSTFVRHPLAAGSEQNYHFQSGDSTLIRLPDGREVRLRELRFTPRRRDPQLIAGSFWLDVATHAVVQAAFRIARPYQLSDVRDDDDAAADADDRGRPPYFLRGVRADITHIAVDYGLWNLRWWLPRYMTMAGVVELGSFGTLPMEYQRSYAEYEIVADTSGSPPPAPDDSVRARCRQGRFTLSVTVGGSDSLRAERTREAIERRRAEAVASDSLFADCPGRYIVTIPDSIDLVRSAALPGSIYGNAEMLSDAELEQLEERVRDLPLPNIGGVALGLDVSPTASGMIRYNRVEGLALGARATVEAGAADGGLGASYGFADEQVSAAADFNVPWHTERVLRLDAYRTLRATDPLAQPFSLPSSLGALLFGSDDTQYYRAAGGSVTVAPAPAREQWYSLRMYLEHQSAARRNTHFSVPHLLDDDRTFRDNISAERADQFGSDLMLRMQHGVDPERLRAGAQLDVRGETGTFEFVRPALTLRGALPPLAGLAAAVEAGAGATIGDAPLQSHWFIGGTHTLRGYPGATLNGESFWRGRAEVATSLPFARLALFSDIGWAGPADADAWRAARPLYSAGVGVSLLDGIVRVDVARALRAPTGWRAHLYLDGLL